MVLRRPDPDALLRRVSEEEGKRERGRLRIFFGASPGVGKTYAMLEAARRERQAGVDVGDVDVDPYFTGVLADLERIFPGVSDAYRADSARRMHWPSYEFTRGSYTCYQPGQWSFWTHEGEREGNVHFCGEHTSADFQGWMEGGAETGALVAAEILGDLGLDPSPELASLLETKSIVPHPTFKRGGTATLTFRARQRLLASRIRRKAGSREVF